MNKTYILAVAAAMLAAPLVYAHAAVGTPDPDCETTAAEFADHDYAAGIGIILTGLQDGSLDLSCSAGTNPTFDGHYEFAIGGAWLLACASNCGFSTFSATGSGGGVNDCWGTDVVTDHNPGTAVAVFDAALSAVGVPVGFIVGADAVNSIGPDPTDPTAPDCGDFESDVGSVCFKECAISFAPGLDGAYTVFVCGGTQGHVTDVYSSTYGWVNTGCLNRWECNDGIDNDGDGQVDYGGDSDCDSWNDRSETTKTGICTKASAANPYVVEYNCTNPDTNLLCGVWVSAYDPSGAPPDDYTWVCSAHGP